jgi:uncharacterized iron-regulated protein
MWTRKLIVMMTFFLLGATGSWAQREDALLETIVRPSDLSRATQADLMNAMLQSELIYFGEKHDNARQHELQVELLQSLINAGKRPAIGFEFFTVGQTSILLNYTQPPANAGMMMGHGQSTLSPEARLRRALGWEHRGDEEWQYYFRLLEIAREHQLPVFATDLPWSLSRRITRGGVGSLHPTEQALWTPTGLDDPAYKELMLQDFTASHCGYRNDAMYRQMYQAWVARNDAMARALVGAIDDNAGEPVIMVVGFGHLQYGMGIPERVAHLRPDTRQLNFAWMEIAMEEQPLADYFPTYTVEGREFEHELDFVWFTQRQNYDDPCAMFRGLGQ